MRTTGSTYTLKRAAATIAAALLLGALACGGGDSPTSPGGDDGNGGNGGNGGTALANGSMTATLNGGAWKATSFIMGRITHSADGQGWTLQVTGVDTTGVGPTRGRQIVLTVIGGTPLATGSFPLGYVTAFPTYSSSGYVQQATDIWSTPIQSLSPTASGAMVLSTLTTGRIAGTFHFTAQPAPANAGAAQATMTVTDGTFDIKLTDG